MKKGLRILLLIITAGIGIYFDNSYLELYLACIGLILFNIKSYYVLILLLAYFKIPKYHFIGLIATIACLLSLFKIKNKTYRLLFSYTIFSISILLLGLNIKDFKFLVISEVVLVILTIMLFFYIKNNLELDHFYNKIFISSLVGLYIFFSKSQALGFFLLLVSFTGKRDFLILVIIGTLAMYHNYNDWPIVLFIIAIAVKRIQTIVPLSIISIYLFKENYLFYLPIILNLLYYLSIQKDYPPTIITKNNYQSYINVLDNNSNSVAPYEELDKRIIDLIKSFCLNCSLNKECFKKKRISLYRYFMYELCQNIPKTKEIDYFIYNCEYKSMMDETPKIAFSLHSNYKSVKELISFESKNELFINHIIKSLNGFNLKEIKVINSESNNASLVFNDYINPNHLNRLLGFKSLVVKQDGLVYKIFNQPKIKVKAESIILSKGGSYIAGDNCLIKSTNTDFYAALSDGMGTGLKAFESSKSVLTKLNSLIELGFIEQDLLKALSHMIQISLYTDSYATLDLLHIDLASASGTLYKVASEETIFIRNNRIKALETKTLPIEFDNILDSYSFEFEHNDLILIISDGVLNFVDKKALYSFILSKSYLSPDKLVYQIGKYIFEVSNKKLQDDTSIVAIRIE